MTAIARPRHEVVAGRVRAFMAERQHNQADLARVLGIAQPNVSVRYRGRRPYSIDELDAIARWLDVRIEDLFRAELDGAPERRRISSDWRTRRDGHGLKRLSPIRLMHHAINQYGHAA